MLLEDRTEAMRPQWRIPCKKGWRGMWSPHGLGMGGRMDQLMVQVDEEVPGHVGWRGKVWLKYGEVERCWWLVERAPFTKRRSPLGESAPFLLAW